MDANDVTKAAAEAAPAVVYGALRLGGMSMPDWVAVATLVYIVLQAAHLIWRWRRLAKRGNGSD
jgi:disulfide bond formation protein DsbB